MTTATRTRKAKKTRILAAEFARTLAERHGCGRRFEPVECWSVPAYGDPEKVAVVMVRGSCDYYHRAYDYAETTDGATVSSRYLFPAATHKRPALVEQSDDFGAFRDWAADPKR